MLPEILLATVILSSGGMLFYLYVDYKRAKARREAEAKEERKQFKVRLRQELKAGRLDRERYRELVYESALELEESHRATKEFIASLARNIISDDHVAAEERVKLRNIARAMTMAPEEADDAITEAAIHRFREYLKADLTGPLNELDSKVSRIETLRDNLNLDHQAIHLAINNMVPEILLNLIRHMAYSEGPTDKNLQQFEDIRRVIDPYGVFHGLALQSELRELHAELVQRFIDTNRLHNSSTTILEWIRKFGGLREKSLQRDLQRLDKAKRLAEYRRGNLPSVQTRELLKADEICHWTGSCSFVYETHTQIRELTGEFLVTSERIYFISPVRSFEYSPSKIIRCQRGRSSLKIQTSSGFGTGRYKVHDPETVAAIIHGVVRKHKLLTKSERIDNERSRHIPDSVKREVWIRDERRCVLCGATDYLEFDHIIPFSKGGSNSAKNIQLLCRRCNLQKRDRI